MAYQFPVAVVTRDQEAYRSRYSFSPSSGGVGGATAPAWSSREKLFQLPVLLVLAHHHNRLCLCLHWSVPCVSVCPFLSLSKVSLDLGFTLIQNDIMWGLNSVSQNTIFLALIKIKKKSYSYVSIPAAWSIQAKSMSSPLELMGPQFCNAPAFSLHPKPDPSVHFLKMYLY